MPEYANTVPRFDLQRLAEAAVDLVADDLDDLYAQRMLNPGAQADGPERDAALAASIFHFQEYTIAETKAYLAEHGVPVRPAPPVN